MGMKYTRLKKEEIFHDTLRRTRGLKDTGGYVHAEYCASVDDRHVPDDCLFQTTEEEDRAGLSEEVYNIDFDGRGS